jgi:hypothetical protein
VNRAAGAGCGADLALVGEYPRGQRHNGLVKVSRVPAHKRIIPRPPKGNDALRGSWPQTRSGHPVGRGRR